MAKQQGWIKLNRSFMEHGFWQEERVFSKAEAWIDLLLSANFDNGQIVLNGQMVTLKPGQFCTTMVHLADRWGWSRSKVDRFILMLEKEGMASIKRTSKYTLITLLNWAKYQNEQSESEHQTNIKRASNEHQTNIKRAQTKNVKNDKNVKNNIYTPSFAKKGGWGKSRPAYKEYETDNTDLSIFEE